MIEEFASTVKATTRPTNGVVSLVTSFPIANVAFARWEFKANYSCGGPSPRGEQLQCSTKAVGPFATKQMENVYSKFANGGRDTTREAINGGMKVRIPLCRLFMWEVV